MPDVRRVARRHSPYRFRIVPRARRPALKLVKTQELSRDDWLAVRRTGIGGSDAAAAVGLNPYMSARELWLDKTGRAEGMPRPDPNDTTSPTYWGTLLEPIVAASYTKLTGNRVRRVHAVLRHPSIRSGGALHAPGF